MEQQQIIADLKARAKAAGLTIGEACRRADIHPTTFSRWTQSEKNPDPIGANLKTLERLKAVIAEVEESGNAAPAEAA